MNSILENLTSPALLFFVLGILAVQFRSDLRVPESSSKFISIYLLMCIGFKGGNELAHNAMTGETFNSLLLGVSLASLIPVFAYFLLRYRLDTYNAGAVAAAYGSVSAVTFVTAISFLEFEGVPFDGHMIAVMAMMEAPAIVIGLLLIRLFNRSSEDDTPSPKPSFGGVLKHSLTNASVFLILGSLLIGFLASDQQAEGIRPFTTDIFKGFLALFLLDMGTQAGSQLGSMRKNGGFLTLFAMLFPFVTGTVSLSLASLFTDSVGNLLLFAILGAGASYIAVPAAYKSAVPQANPGIYLPMALGITFPVNIIIGIPFYYYLIQKMGPLMLAGAPY